ESRGLRQRIGGGGAADPAGGGGVDVPGRCRLGIPHARSQPHASDVVVAGPVRGDAGGEVDLLDVVHGGHNRLGEQIAGDELDVIAGGAHGHGVLFTLQLHLQRLLPGQGVGAGGGLTGGVELVDSGANRLAPLHSSHPSSGVASVVGTSDFRGTHSAFLLLAKSLSLTLSHAPAGGCQTRRIAAVATPSVRPGAAGGSDAGSVVGGVLDGGLDVLEEFVDDGDAVGDSSLRAGEVDDEGPS